MAEKDIEKKREGIWRFYSIITQHVEGFCLKCNVIL